MISRETGEPAASVSAGRFEVIIWVTDAGLSRLMPPRSLPAITAKEANSLRLTIKRELSEEERRHVEETAEFLVAVMEGREPVRVPRADLSGVSVFTAEILEETGRIPWGQVRSYGWLAARVGRRDAARAAGGALGRNPVPIIVPCHRVVRADGSPGGFGLGRGFKQWLLALEGHEFGPDKGV